MANKAEVAAVNEIYKTAREQADSELARLRGEIEGEKAEQFMLGIIAKINYDAAHNNLLKYAVLYQYKQKKTYLKGGKSWEAFLQSISEERRNVDRIFDDLRPLYDDFQGQLSVLANLPFNKIRYLGRSLQGNLSGIEEGCLVFDGERIPVTPEHTDEIEAVIDKLREIHRRDKEEAESVIKAKERVITSHIKTIGEQEKLIAKHERKLKERGLLPGEEEFYRQLADVKGLFDLWEGKLDPVEIDLEDASPRMRATLIETLGYIARIADDLYQKALDMYGTTAVDGDGYKFPHERQADGISEKAAG